jgi:hypothetical protein
LLLKITMGTRKDFFENYPHFWHAPSKRFTSRVVGRKSLKNIGLNGRQIVSLPWAITCLGLALDLTVTFQLFL